MLKITLVLLLCFSSAFAISDVRLLHSKEYIKALAQQFVYELEDYGVCNTKLPDIFQNISIGNFFGMNVVGTIDYTNGFISTFQEVGLKTNAQEATINEAENSAYMFVDLIISSLIIFYDYHASLSDGDFNGTVAIPKDYLEIQLQVKKYYNKPEVLTYNVEIKGTSPAAIFTVWDYIPYNKYTEVINRNIMLSLMDDEFKEKIEEFWKKILGKAIKKLPFPQMCYFC